jgi:hypothetical protein
MEPKERAQTITKVPVAVREGNATRPPSWVANEKIGALSPLRENSRLSALAFCLLGYVTALRNCVA